MSQLDIQPDAQSADHGHGHDHEHPAHLGHHWENSKQQFEAGKLGMWLFLATEVLLFGGLFVAYAVWRANHPELFKYGSQYLDTTMGAINTCVLLLSSMTMAMAVTFAARGRNLAVVICLVLTLFGAGGFMIIKYFEYSHKFHEGFLPGMAFYEQPNASHLGFGALGSIERRVLPATHHKHSRHAKNSGRDCPCDMLGCSYVFIAVVAVHVLPDATCVCVCEIRWLPLPP